jgi:DDE family transposase
MPFYAPVPFGSRFADAQQLLQDDDPTLLGALPDALVQQAAQDTDLHFAEGAEDVFTPTVTLWTFLTQALSGSRSCVAAVARTMVLLVALGRPPCSANSGGYCKARAKLSVAFLQQLTYAVGNGTEDQAPDLWRWQGRRVLLVDGSEVTAADTEANQKVYPQPTTQQPGLGFPMIRLVVLLTFATAALVGAAWGPHAGKETGETALFRQLFDQLRAGDVVVADRYQCSYAMIALVQLTGASAAFRLHQRRDYDFRRGQRLGTGDHIVSWTKPARPEWMDEAQYAQLPATLRIREVRFQVTEPGYRSKEIIVATTLCDAEAYSKAMIADLYHQRWHVELDIRTLKQTLHLEHLRCQTPAMIDRELWVHLLGYNLIRKVMAQAAQPKGWSPRQLSFAGAFQTLEAFRWVLLFGSATRQQEIWGVVLIAVGTHKVGDRPGRCEPRKVKRRPKSYPLLRRPRAEERGQLLEGTEA